MFDYNYNYTPGYQGRNTIQGSPSHCGNESKIVIAFSERERNKWLAHETNAQLLHLRDNVISILAHPSEV